MYCGILNCLDCTQIVTEDPIEMPVAYDFDIPMYCDCYLVYSQIDEYNLDKLLMPGHLIDHVSPDMLDLEDQRLYTAYMFALQSILKADRSVVGHLTGRPNNFYHSTAQILGIGEIAALGFTNLVIAIGHLNMLIYMVKFFNRIITVRKITLRDILKASVTTVSDDLYKELCNAFPIDNIRRQVEAEGWLAVEPVSVSAGGKGVLGIIQAILNMTLVDRVLSMETLPSFQCGTFPEWYLVIELNIMHRIFREYLRTKVINDESIGRLCVALKTVEIPDNIVTGSDMIETMLAHMMRCMELSPEWNTLRNCTELQLLISNEGFRRKPLLRTEVSLARWVTGIKNKTEISDCEPELPILQISDELPELSNMLYQELLLPTHVGKVESSDIAYSVEPSYVNVKYRIDHVFRLDGVSTASGKLLCLGKFFREKANHVICLGEGEGSIAATFFKCFGTSKLFYNSLINTNNYPTGRFVHYVPSELRGIGVQRLYKYYLTLYGNNDIRLEACHELLKKHLAANDWDVVTCDAEIAKYGPREAFELLRGACIIAIHCLKADGVFIFKTYIGLNAIVKQQIQTLRCLFQQVYVTTPLFSSNESTEVYIVCVNIIVHNIRSVLLNFYNYMYSKDNLDIITFEKLIDDYNLKRVEQKLPLQFQNSTVARKIVQYLRENYKRPTWLLSLLTLTGGICSNVQRLEAWLQECYEHHECVLNALLYAAYEESALGFQLIRMPAVQIKTKPIGNRVYETIRYMIHIHILLVILKIKRSNISLQQIIDLAKVLINKYYSIKIDTGFELCSFSLTQHEREWSRKYARHLFRVVGEIYFFM